MDHAASGDPPAVAEGARPVAASWLLQVGSFAIAALVVGFTLLQGQSSLPPSGAALWVTAVPTLLAPLFWSGSHAPRSQLAASMLSWAFVALLMAVIGWTVCGMRFTLAPLALASAVALGVLVVAYQAAALIEATLAGFGIRGAKVWESAVWSVTAVLWLAASTPLWLGPVADLSARQSPLAPSFILAWSPLAQMAAAAGNDFLRGQWFYGHSSLGSLQVDYPRVGAVLVAYLLLAATLTALLASVRRWSQQPK